MNSTWTADELHNVIDRAKNAVNKNKAFEQLANETGRSFKTVWDTNKCCKTYN